MRKLVLDFGGVVIRTPFEMRHRIGNPPWFGPFAPDVDPMWQKLLDGDLTERDYWQSRAEEVFGDTADPIRALMDELFAPPASEVVRPETLDLLQQAGDVSVLTNDLSRFHDDDWLGQMGLSGRFEQIVDLSYASHLKPAPQAFEYACATLRVAPVDVLFVDDHQHNVEGARAAGLYGVWFDVTDPPGSVSRILDHLG